MQRRARIAGRCKPVCLRKHLAESWLSSGITQAAQGSLPDEPTECPPSAGDQASAPFQPPMPRELSRLLEGFCPEPGHEQQIAVNSNGLMLFLRLADIEWLEAVDEGVAIHVGQTAHRVRDTFEAMAAKLPSSGFLCLSPSTLVNVAHLAKLAPRLRGDCPMLESQASNETHPGQPESDRQGNSLRGRWWPHFTSPGRVVRRHARRGCRSGDSRC